MNLDDGLIRDFVSVVKQPNKTRSPTNVFGTIVKNDSGTFIQVDGSDILTPCASTVEIGDGDRVLCSIENHRATVMGNLSFPSLTRVGEIYVITTNEGVIIGKLDSNNQPTGNHILLSPTDGCVIRTSSGQPLAKLKGDGSQILDASGNVIASYGSTTQVGKEDSVHTVFDGSYFTVYDSSNNIAFRVKPAFLLVDQLMDTEILTRSGAGFTFGGNVHVAPSQSNKAGIIDVIGSAPNCDDIQLLSAISGRSGLYRNSSGKWLIYHGSIADGDMTFIPDYCIHDVYVNTSSEKIETLKYSDGRLVTSMRLTLSADFTNNTGGLYYTGSSVSVPNFPITYSVIPTINVTIEHPTGQPLVGLFAKGPGSTTNPGSLNLFKGTSATGVSFIANIVAEGRWQ